MPTLTAAIGYFNPMFFEFGLNRHYRRLTRFFDQHFRDHPETDRNVEWGEWASRLPRSAFLVWLAGQVADDLITHRRRSDTVEGLLDSISESTSCDLQHQAERFLENHYFGYPSFSPQCSRVIIVFRKVVQRKIRHSLV